MSMVDISRFYNVSALGFSIEEAQTVIQPLVLFVAGIVIYSIFIFKFYRFIASRDIFKLNLRQYSESFMGFLGNILSGIFYVIEYLLLFPLFAFLWSSFLAVVLMALSRAEVGTTLMISIALVAAIRVTAYYNEELSKDLAKMIPFALLGVFLIDMSYFSFEIFIVKIKTIPLLGQQLLYYLGFVIVVELILRILYTIVSPFKSEESKKK